MYLKLMPPAIYCSRIFELHSLYTFKHSLYVCNYCFLYAYTHIHTLTQTHTYIYFQNYTCVAIHFFSYL